MADCKKGYEFEIKTDKRNGLSTLPPSTHRDDKNFRYSAVGRMDKLLVNDALYDLFIDLFEEYLRKYDNIKNSNDDDDDDDKNNSTAIKNRDEKQQKDIVVYYDLTPQTIQISIDHLLPFYIDGDRNNFVFSFSGTAFHSHLSEESASSIVEGICDRTSDNEKQNRLVTVHSTYKNGIKGRCITGAPSLADLLGRIKGYNQSFVNGSIDILKKLWQKDISNKGNQDSENNKVPKELSVSQAKRAKEEFVKVKGTIVGQSPVYNMIKSVTWICDICEFKSKIELPIPKFKSQFKEIRDCPKCRVEKDLKDTAAATYEYVSVVDIELQGLDGFNEIERLPIKCFVA